MVRTPTIVVGHVGHVLMYWYVVNHLDGASEMDLEANLQTTHPCILVIQQSITFHVSHIHLTYSSTTFNVSPSFFRAPIFCYTVCLMRNYWGATDQGLHAHVRQLVLCRTDSMITYMVVYIVVWLIPYHIILISLSLHWMPTWCLFPNLPAPTYCHTHCYCYSVI